MARSPARRSRRRRMAWLLAPPLLLLAAWIAIHRVPGLGSFLADTARSVVGPDAVAKLEDFAYGVEDRWNRLWRSNDAPTAYWEVPETPAVGDAPSAPGAPGASTTAKPGAPAESEPELPPFRLDNVPPVHASWSAPGDGVWMPIVDARRPGDAPRMYKTLLHPDRNRSWAAVSVVAVDLRRVALHLVAGSREPESVTPEAKEYTRPAVVDPEHHDDLLAAFNGAFKTTHGGHGIKVSGVTLAPPRKVACAVAQRRDGTLAVRAWEALEAEEPDLAWWRQMPQCMVEQGKTHPGLGVESNTHWGATLDRETVIRRSAIGLSQRGDVLYVGIGDSTTAPAIAAAMKHAGAFDVAQLDVNFSFPKFLLYAPKEPGSTELVALPLTKNFEFTEDEYVRKRAVRDFFYLTRKRFGVPR